MRGREGSPTLEQLARESRGRASDVSSESRARSRTPARGQLEKPDEEVAFFQEISEKELKKDFVDTWSSVPKVKDDEDPDTMHMPRCWSETR